MSRPLVAHVSRESLEHNLAVARRLAQDAKLMAVVKADGYGHGLATVAGAFRDADALAVLTLDEAVRLRDAGWTKAILMLEGFFGADELSDFAARELMAVVHTFEQISMLEGTQMAAPIAVFLKLNTGMNRLGIPPGRLPDALFRLGKCMNVAGITLMTHFACADEAPGVADQMVVFDATTSGLPFPVSLANSAALMRHAVTRRGWVRPGIMLYGASPFAGESASRIGLRPAMTLASEIIAVQDVKPGGKVGYGAAFVAESDMRVGVVACGYADGYPRHAATGTPILVGGRRTRTLGRVSMDMLLVDLTGLPESGMGSEVVLWGEGLPVEEVAMAAATISYELLTARSARVPVRVT